MKEHWFDHFWTSPVDAPGELAFGLFSSAHWAALGVQAIIVVALVWWYRRAGAKARTSIRLGVGITAFIVEAFRHVAFIALGIYTPAILPLHLCAIATICLVVDAIKPNTWTREYLYAVGTWGPVCALVFADWADQPIINIYSWQSFLAHGLIIGYVLMILVSGDFRPNPRQLWKAGLIVLGAASVSMVVNSIYSTNFWFLAAGSPGSPLEPIQNLTGALYIPTLAVLLAILWTLMYLPWRRRKRRPSTVDQ